MVAVYSGDGNFTGSASAPVGVVINPDVTSLFTITPGKPRRHGGRFRVVVTLKNTSGTAVPMPLYLVLDNLTGGVQVVGAAGTTKLLPPLGSPFVTVPLGGAGVVPPGATLTVNVDFSGRAARKVTFKTRLLAGLNQV